MKSYARLCLIPFDPRLTYTFNYSFAFNVGFMLVVLWIVLVQVRFLIL